MIALIANEKTAATHVGSLVRPCSFDSNVFSERLWRSVKYENIYLNQYDTVRQLQTGLIAHFDFFNHERPHQSLNYRTLAEEHFVL